MRARWLVLGSIVLVAACQDVTEPSQPFDPQAAAVPQQGQGDEQSALARAVPAFGGFFFDEAGRPTAYLTDRGQERALRARIGMLSAMRGHSADELVILRGNFPYAQLEAGFGRATQAAFELEGTVFTDLDEARNLVVVAVEREGLVNGARVALGRAGLTAASYDVIVRDPIYQVRTLQQRFDTTVAGIQIHFTRYVCSLGANVKSGGVTSFITASHCTARQGGVEGTVYYQPTSSVDPAVIATEVADPIYFKGGVCPKGRVCRYSDAARAEYTAARTVRPGIALTQVGSLTLTGYADVNGTTGEPAKGATVKKVGRTTGLTAGSITQTCAAVGVSGSKIVQLCQNIVESSSTIVSGGDSGSGVWTGSGSTATLVGILWGGSSDNKLFVYSPWSGVVSELGPLTVSW